MPARSVNKRRKSRKQKGGTILTTAQIDVLSSLGFTDDQKKRFGSIVEPLGARATNMMITALPDDIRRINPQTGVAFTPQELIDSLNVGGGKRRRKSKKMRKSKKVRKSKKSRKTRKQRGGADFSQAQTQQLLDMGFTEANIETLAQLFLDDMSGDAAMKLIQTSLGQINNITGQPNTPQEIIDSLNPDNNENDLSGIGSENGSENDVSVGSFAFEDEDNLSDIDDDNSQHNISDDSVDFGQDDDLNNNNIDNIDDISEDSISDQGDTTNEKSSLMDIGELQGGRRRKTRKGRKGKKSRKTKKQRGGMRYGTGVGSNCFDPNYSIYNTPALTLFPYKPN
jgi:hypothetical protein